MKLFVLFLAMLTVCSTPAMAQNNPKVELFGGYSYARSDFFQEELDKVNSNGWRGSVSVPLSFGIEGAVDVSGHYGEAKKPN